MSKEVCLIDSNDNLIEALYKCFNLDLDYDFKRVYCEEIESNFKDNIPDFILINEDNITMNIHELFRIIRTNEDNRIIPIIVYSSNEEKNHKIEIIRDEAEYFVESSMGLEYLYYVIKSIGKLLLANRTVSPLTGLPGNVQIQTELRKRLFKGKNFTVLYLDLDNFKSYNDLYGFLKGDEIIKLTGRVITKNVHEENENAFVGHIGGDDFVAILDSNDNFEKICQNIIADFDVEVKKYFNDDDIEKGFFEIVNRKGIIEEFPLTSISIGAVIVEENRFMNILEIGEIGAQVKHIAKGTMRKLLCSK